LIQQILDLQSIIGNIHSWVTKSKYNDNIISAVDIIDSDITNIYHTKQDKIDYNIQGNNKDIVSVLNSIISKKIIVQDLDELYTMNLESGVYELIYNVNIPNTPITSYLLIC
jgi:predicted HAD superfamily phosphohydrolase